MRRFFRKYATFSGRASRSECWWWALVSFGASIVINLFLLALGSDSVAYGLGSALVLLVSLAVLVPSLALTVRRLHDGNFSGWLLLLALVPFVGVIALLVFTLISPNPAGQRFDRPG